MHVLENSWTYRQYCQMIWNFARWSGRFAGTNLEAVGFAGDIHPTEISQIGKLCISVVLEESDDRDDSVGVDQHFQLIATGDLNLLDVLRHTLAHIPTKVLQGGPQEGVLWPHCRGRRPGRGHIAALSSLQKLRGDGCGSESHRTCRVHEEGYAQVRLWIGWLGDTKDLGPVYSPTEH